MGLLPGDLGADDDALIGEDRGLARGDGNLKGLGGCLDWGLVSRPLLYGRK